MSLFIQTIVITWSEDSRGGELAALRARIPEQRPVRQITKLTGTLWHSLAYSEDNCFNSPVREKLKTTSLPFQFASSKVNWQDDSAILTYKYVDGAPTRTYYDKSSTLTPIQHSLRISGNSWAFLEYNNRRSDLDTGAWWYEHFVVSVAIGDLQNPFTTPPTNQLSLLSQLW